MASVIPLEALDVETRERLGINMPPELGDMGRSLIQLGTVLKVLEKLSDDEALDILRQASMYILSRKFRPEIDSLGVAQNEPARVYKPPVDWVLEIVARMFGLKVESLKERDRSVAVTQARQVAMYVLWKTDRYTLAQIGYGIGGRSPATVNHGFGKIVHQLKRDSYLRGQVEDILRLMGDSDG